MKFLNRKGNSVIIVVVIAAVVALGLFAYLNFNTTTAFVVQNGVIQSGTKITQEMLTDGTIAMREIPKSLANDYIITDFDEINGMYVKDVLKPGKIIFSYDIAKSGDLRNNEILTTYALEAVTLTSEQITGLSDVANKNDKVNVYGTYNYSFKNLKDTFGGQGFPVSALVPEIQEVFIANGYKPTDIITAEEVTITKLLLQNVPIVDVKKDEYDTIQKVTIGVEPEHAEAIYLTLHTTGRIGLTVLPYSDGNYVEKNTKGSITTLELKNGGIINDVGQGN
jgi:hypothetical protein